jgi:hypothetical protein
MTYSHTWIRYLSGSGCVRMILLGRGDVQRAADWLAITWNGGVIVASDY